MDQGNGSLPPATKGPHVQDELMKKTIYGNRDSVGKIESVTGVILAGGASRRMGSDKALLPFGHARFIESIYRQMSVLFMEVIIVCKSPEQYPFLPCRQEVDL